MTRTPCHIAVPSSYNSLGIIFAHLELVQRPRTSPAAVTAVKVRYNLRHVEAVCYIVMAAQAGHGIKIASFRFNHFKHYFEDRVRIASMIHCSSPVVIPRLMSATLNPLQHSGQWRLPKSLVMVTHSGAVMLTTLSRLIPVYLTVARVRCGRRS